MEELIVASADSVSQTHPFRDVVMASPETDPIETLQIMAITKFTVGGTSDV